MRIQRGGALILVLLASCGGSAKATTATTSVTTAAALTTVAVTTTAPSTAPTPSVTPTTTVAPTTTAPFVPIRQQVTEAVIKHGRLQIACFSAPTRCDVRAITASQGTLRDNMTKGVELMVERRYEARESDADRYAISVTGVEVAEDDRSAIVSVCLWDPVPVFQVHGAPDGTDILINSVKNTERRTFVTYLEAGEWRVGETTKLSTVKGRNECV